MDLDPFSDWSVHYRQCNTGESEGSLNGFPSTFPEQAALGLQLCPDLKWANCTCLSLVPEGEEKIPCEPYQSKLQIIVHFKVKCKNLFVPEVWTVGSISVQLIQLLECMGKG